MSYMECPQCGQKALSVATRCPHCGVAFPSQPFRLPAPVRRIDRLRMALAIGGVLVLAVLLFFAGSRLRPRPGAVMPRSPDAGAVAAAPVAEPDSLAPADAPGHAAELPQPEAQPAVRGPGLRRFARTWVYVRGGRGMAAPALSVLNPGEAVVVDSLRRGWYRVVVDGRTAGYVHRSNLDAAPPPSRP